MISFLKEAATKPEILGMVGITACAYFLLIFGLVKKLRISPQAHKLITFIFIVIIPGTNVFPLYYFHPFWLKNTGVMSIIAWLTYASVGLILSSKTRHSLSQFSFLTKDSFIALLLLIIPISTLWSDVPWITFTNSVVFLLMTFIAAHIGAEYKLSELSSLLRWGSLVVVLLSLFSGIFLPEIGLAEKGLRGVLTHPNPMGIYAVIHLLLWLLNWLDPRAKGKRISLLAMSAYLIAVILTNSASSLIQLLMLTFALTIPVVIIKFSRNKSMLVLNTILAAAIMLGIFVAYNISGVLGLVGRDMTLTGRTDFWPQLLQLIAEKPIWGYGFWGFWTNADGPAATVGTRYFQPIHAHNGFLDTAVDLGVVGLSLVLFSITRNIFFGFKVLRKDRYETIIPLLITFFLISANMTESRLLKTDFIWFYYAVVVTKLNINQKYSQDFLYK